MIWSNNKAVTEPTDCWHVLKCIQTGNENNWTCPVYRAQVTRWARSNGVGLIKAEMLELLWRGRSDRSCFPCFVFHFPVCWKAWAAPRGPAPGLVQCWVLEPGPSCPPSPSALGELPRGSGWGGSASLLCQHFVLLFTILVWFLVIFFGEMSQSLMSECSILNANRNSIHFIYCGLWLHFQNYGLSSRFLLQLGLAKELNC